MHDYSEVSPSMFNGAYSQVCTELHQHNHASPFRTSEGINPDPKRQPSEGTANALHTQKAHMHTEAQCVQRMATLQ